MIARGLGGAIASAALGVVVPAPALPAATPASDLMFVDAVAAVVDRRVITVSQVRAEATLTVLERIGDAAVHATVDARLMQAVLDQVVLQELIAAQAQRASVSATSSFEADVRSAAQLAAWSTPTALALRARDDVDDNFIRARVRRDLLVERYLAVTLAPAHEVSAADAAEFAASHPHEPDALSAVRERQRRALFDALVAKLRLTFEVRVVAHFD